MTPLEALIVVMSVDRNQPYDRATGDVLAVAVNLVRNECAAIITRETEKREIERRAPYEIPQDHVNPNYRMRGGGGD